MTESASRRGVMEAGLGPSDERWRLIVDNVRDHAIFVIDPNGFVVEWYGGAEAIFGYSAREMLGRDGDVLYLPEDRAAGIPAHERAGAGAEVQAPDVRWHLHKDGHQVLIDGVATALHDENGAVAGFMKIGADVTARHVADQHQKSLLAEIHHRVRNTLAVVRSIVRRTADKSRSVEEMSAHLQGRIDAFARVQAVVTRDIEAVADLGALIADELLAHATPEGGRLTIDGPDLLLVPKTAETFSLAVHELTTNSVKFGALGAREGSVRVRWTLASGGAEGERLEFVWEERGRDRPLVAAERSGFGFEFLRRSLPYELDAETEILFLDGGLRFTLRMPTAGRIADGEEGDAPPARTAGAGSERSRRV